MQQQSRHVSVFIDRPVAEVYDYASDPNNLPHWAAGLASGIRIEDGQVVADSPMGRIEIVFAPRNEFGVLDHDVITPDGTRTYNPMRVVASGGSSEVIFSVRRRDTSQEDFDNDCAAVLVDLESLKSIME
ncbi:SRPBCC family protein [Microlunatus elymi]|nr:SRPBCC family protein [Microlunatus elymi]